MAAVLESLGNITPESGGDVCADGDKDVFVSGKDGSRDVYASGKDVYVSGKDGSRDVYVSGKDMYVSGKDVYASGKDGGLKYVEDSEDLVCEFDERVEGDCTLDSKSSGIDLYIGGSASVSDTKNNDGIVFETVENVNIDSSKTDDKCFGDILETDVLDGSERIVESAEGIVDLFEDEETEVFEDVSVGETCVFEEIESSIPEDVLNEASFNGDSSDLLSTPAYLLPPSSEQPSPTPLLDRRFLKKSLPVFSFSGSSHISVYDTSLHNGGTLHPCIPPVQILQTSSLVEKSQNSLWNDGSMIQIPLAGSSLMENSFEYGEDVDISLPVCEEVVESWPEEEYLYHEYASIIRKYPHFRDVIMKQPLVRLKLKKLDKKKRRKYNCQYVYC